MLAFPSTALMTPICIRMLTARPSDHSHTAGGQKPAATDSTLSAPNTVRVTQLEAAKTSCRAALAVAGAASGSCVLTSGAVAAR